MSLPLEPIPMQPGGSDQPPRIPCDEFEPMLGLHLDRELTRAEEVRLDEHLDTCAKCRARLGHLEAMSSALKAWDVETNNAVPATDRIQRSVLSRVAETSHRRRIDDRVLRIVQFATAACVLVALGVGLVFGMTWERPLDTNVASTDIEPVYQIGVDDLPEVDVPEARSLASLPSMAVTRDVESLRGKEHPVVEFERSNGRALDMAQIARLDVFRRKLEQEVQLGERGVLFMLPGQDEPRVLARSAYVYAQEQGWLDRWSTPYQSTVEPGLPEATASRTDPEAAEPVAFGLALRDMLKAMPGMRGERADVELARAPILASWPTVPGDVRARDRVHAHGLSRATPGAPLELVSGSAKRIEAVDPILAQKKGWLRFEESGIDKETVVAFVKGNAQPILIPAGQILTSGLTDRVVAEPIFLPAAPRGERRESIPCRVVRVGPDRDETSPRLTPWIAGPSLRSLLTQGASEDAVLAAAEAAFRGANGGLPGHLGEWSLVDLYANALEKVTGRFSGQAISGIVITDGQGLLLGVEYAPIAGDAGTALLARLFVGYAIDARHRQHVTDGSWDVARPTLHVDEAFELFRRDATEFVAARQSATGDVPAVRLSSVRLARARFVFQALEIDGEPALVTGAPALRASDFEPK